MPDTAFFSASVAAVITYAVGSTALVSSNDSWYQSLKKPRWQPNSVVFGVIWPYNFGILIAASWAIANASTTQSNMKVQWLLFLYTSVAAALLWAHLFYGRHNLRTAAICLAAATLLTLPLTRIAFFTSSGWGLSLVPYQLWLLLATLLSFEYARLQAKQ